MKVKLLLLFLICLNFTILSQKVNPEKAESIARNAYLQKNENLKSLKSLPNINMVLVHEEKSTLKGSEDRVLYYVFNIQNNGGFVIISADERVYPLLACSFKGGYSNDTRPPAFDDWMGHYAIQIDYAIKNNIPASEKVKQEWELLINNQKHVNKSFKSVSPLLTTTWNQGRYYNAECPYDVTGIDNHTYVGCVAVAMGQIMKYHNFPLTGKDSHDYNHPDYGYLSADFGNTYYNWANMPNSLNDYNSSVAELLYHCGVSVEMNYGTADGSGAPAIFVPDALETYFYYSLDANHISRSDYTETDWINLLKNELDNRRPIFYGGNNGLPAPNTSGHAFVLDGYNDNGEFNINWGWGGSQDGYFYINDLVPSANHDYRYDQIAIIGIKPDPSYQSISINSPSISTSWESGTSQTINWNSSGISTNSELLVEYYNGSSWSIVQQSTQNNGTLSFNVPAINTTVTNASIKISLVTNPQVYDYSDDFTVTKVNKKITVTYPQNDSRWRYNTYETVTWTSENIEAYEELKIEFYNGNDWSSLYTTTNNDGEQNIEVPEILKTIYNAQIRISLISNTEVKDESEPFIVHKPKSVVNIEVDQYGIESCITGIENTFPADKIKIYPNPNEGIFEVDIKELDYKGKIKILVLNEAGQIIYYDHSETNQCKRIDLTGQKGTFVLTILGNPYKYSSKIIIK